MRIKGLRETLSLVVKGLCGFGHFMTLFKKCSLISARFLLSPLLVSFENIKNASGSSLEEFKI